MNTPAPAFQLPTTPGVAPAPAVPPPAPGPAPAPTPGENLAVYVEKYRQLRDKKKALADEFKDAVAPYNEAMGQLESLILDALNRAGVESVRTSAGTAYKSTRSSYTVKDPAQFREWIESNNRFDLLETRVSKEAIETLVESGATLPPGLGISSEVVVNIRK